MAAEPGRRDPLTDIRATRQIQRIWCAGVESALPAHDLGAPA
ncbi:hypothetical protein [Actinospica durhamensis]|nr:hypothetical protein [Actinospica durhamensis]